MNEIKQQEQAYLTKVLALLDARIAALDESAQAYRAEIRETREFLWENYWQNRFEMDTHERDLEEGLQNLAREAERVRALFTLRQTPYFARIDFTPDDTGEKETFYIGQAGFYDETTFAPYVCDWRSPLGSLYYEFEPGRASYMSPGGEIGGQLHLKRQITMENGQITGLFDTDLAIRDQVLIDFLASGAKAHMQNIAATIQREQNAAVRDESARVLLVSGVAGSGKTSVALHRIAYLLYRRRGKLQSDNIIIFSPNSLFSDYISDVMPQLGEENVWQTTFTKLAKGLVGARVQTQQEHLEDALDYGFNEISLAIAKEKSTAAFADALCAYVTKRANGEFTFADCTLMDKVLISKAEMAQTFARSRELLTAQGRMERILALFEEREREGRKAAIQQLAEKMEYEAEPGEYLSFDEVKRAAKGVYMGQVNQEKARLRGMVTLNSAKIYEDFLRSYFAKGKTHVAAKRFALSLARGSLLWEDTAPLLLVKCLLGQARPVYTMRHVVVDEAQDYSAAHYRVLAFLYPKASFTILGDGNQQIDPTLAQNGLACAGGEFAGAKHIHLSRCYRLTKQICAYADGIVGGQTPCVERDGAEVTQLDYASGREKARLCREFAKKHKNVAIITKNLRGAYQLASLLGGKQSEFRVLREGTMDDLEGPRIVPLYLAKGLEFDHVLLDADGMSAHQHYVAATRAMKDLTVLTHYEEKEE